MTCRPADIERQCHREQNFNWNSKKGGNERKHRKPWASSAGFPRCDQVRSQMVMYVASMREPDVVRGSCTAQHQVRDMRVREMTKRTLRSCSRASFRLDYIQSKSELALLTFTYSCVKIAFLGHLFVCVRSARGCDNTTATGRGSLLWKVQSVLQLEQVYHTVHNFFRIL